MADAKADGTIQVMCGRGCGSILDVDQNMVTNMVALGQPLVFEHADGQCPTELADAARGEERPDRRFRVQLAGFEVPLDADVPEGSWIPRDGWPVRGAQVLGGLGHDVTAKTFAAAVNGPFTRWLAERTMSAGGMDRRLVSAWDRFCEMAAFADTELPPAPPPSPQEPSRRVGPGGAVLLG